ncbi:MAG: NAD(P)-dependent oxidoreductase, partial [Chloroflexi bacterium]|nr:NAD(P)-dependent oxidoreductase [Chloroflexota bacterium]
IGSALARTLLDRGERVIGLENGFSIQPSALRRLADDPGWQLVRGSVNSVGSIERAFAAAGRGERVETVYHLAAQASAHPEAARPSYTEATNLVAPRFVFEAAARHRVERFVYGSSFRVYGDDLAGTVDERRPYGRIGDLSHLSKVYAEKLVEMLSRQHELPAANVRLGVVYGLGPTMKRDPRFLTVPNLFCLRAARGEPLVVHAGANRPIGFLHLDDAVEALLVAARLGAEPGSRAYNAVSEVLTGGEVAGIVAACARRRGLAVRVEGAAPSPEMRWSVHSGLDDMGFHPRRAMDESLDEVLAYYLDEGNG